MVEVLRRLEAQQLGGGLACPWCGLQGLSPEALWHHAPLYHTWDPNVAATCDICSRCAWAAA